jgi:hypothetical protein
VAQHHRPQPTSDRDHLTTRPQGPNRRTQEGWADQQLPHTYTQDRRQKLPSATSPGSVHGSRFSPNPSVSRRKSLPQHRSIWYQAGPRDPRHVRAMSADLDKAQAEGVTTAATASNQ